MQVQPHVGRVDVHGRPSTRPLAELIDDGVLDLQRGELRVRDRRAAARAIDGQRAVDGEMLAPVDGAHAVVERLGSRRRKRGDSSSTRFATRDHRHARYACSSVAVARHAAALDFDVDDAARRELLGRQIRRAGRRRDVEGIQERDLVWWFRRGRVGRHAKRCVPRTHAARPSREVTFGEIVEIRRIDTGCGTQRAEQRLVRQRRAGRPRERARATTRSSSLRCVAASRTGQS